MGVLKNLLIEKKQLVVDGNSLTLSFAGRVAYTETIDPTMLTIWGIKNRPVLLGDAAYVSLLSNDFDRCKWAVRNDAGHFPMKVDVPPDNGNNIDTLLTQRFFWLSKANHEFILQNICTHKRLWVMQDKRHNGTKLVGMKLTDTISKCLYAVIYSVERV